MNLKIFLGAFYPKTFSTFIDCKTTKKELIKLGTFVNISFKGRK